MDFAYTAKSKNGQTMGGTIDAGSIAEARQTLRGQGLFPLSLTAARSTAARRSGWFARRRRVSKTDLLMMTSQLAIMCRTGVDLADALKNVAGQCATPRLREVMEAVYEDVSAGQLVSVALGKHPTVFDPAYVASMAAGEASGEVTGILARLAEHLRHEIRLRSTLYSILAYPVVLSSVSSLAVAALILFVLPQFASIFDDLGTTPPALTQLLLGGAQWLRENMVLVLPSVAAALAAGVWILRTEIAARYRDKLLLDLSIIRGATRSLLTGRVFRIMGIMLQSGIPLLDTIRLCQSAVKNRVYRELFAALEYDIINGSGIGSAFAGAEFVPPGAAQMVTTAEQVGELGSVMQMVGEFYEEDGERRLRQLVKLLEPAVIVAMGAIVACVVLAVMLPLLDVSAVAA
jgi:type II secretory pathway component PulF